MHTVGNFFFDDLFAGNNNGAVVDGFIAQITITNGCFGKNSGKVFSDNR